ncbi:hypothetical protein H6P81_005813 [Aristolochia fimbriata]|uniref:Uncharacterized protein n=1 Tax=Aristolochia fimbriata TaxID=158543 RepID=A0AAV7EW97_ARIFI|nr:hypothetical protein H6P81_005813 [Aristolochia fimbriata]
METAGDDSKRQCAVLQAYLKSTECEMEISDGGKVLAEGDIWEGSSPVEWRRKRHAWPLQIPRSRGHQTLQLKTVSRTLESSGSYRIRAQKRPMFLSFTCVCMTCNHSSLVN